MVDYHDYRDIQRMVGGSFTTGFFWPSGDILFVDDEGLFKPQKHFFRIAGTEHYQVRFWRLDRTCSSAVFTTST